MPKYLVHKKWRPREGRSFKDKKTADSFMSRVKRAGGAKLVRVKVRK